MAVQGYFDIFPEKTRTELRTAIFEDGDADDLLPDGTFLFTEYFCTDRKCDCQRVLVKVFHTQSQFAPPKDVATISYSWNPSSDETWGIVNSGMPNPFLDPFHPQASYASELLDFWSEMIERDKVYASRIQRHYDEIRAEIAGPAAKRDRWHSTSHQAHKGPVRSHSKRNRKSRKRRSARTRKRQ